MDKPKIVITIDGPAGSGKSTVANEIAWKLRILHLDTGALYRSIAYKAISLGIDPNDAKGITAFLPDTKLDVEFAYGAQHCILDGNDISEHIRSREVSAGASAVSAIKEVRSFLLEIQRGIAATQNVVLDGRDTGSVIVKDAPFKFYLTASALVRTKRRYEELKSKNALNGATLETIRQEMVRRDYMDTHREFSPLICPDDAVYIDSTYMTATKVVKKIMSVLKEAGISDHA